MLTLHHKVAILLFHGGGLVSLITFEGTILYQTVNGKMEGNGVVAKLLFLVSLYEFPLFL